MKRQTLTIGGALLASTALSASATAGTIVSNVANGAALGTTLATQALSAQVFPTTSAENTTIGPVGFTVNFTNSFTTAVDVDLESTNSDFTGTMIVTALEATSSTSGSLFALGSVGSDFSGCSVQVLTERILVEDCSQTGGGSIDALSYSSVTFNEANGLATAGASIAIVNGIVRGSQSGNTFETISSGTITTSADSASVSVTTPASITISNSATPPFSGIGAGNASTATIGNVRLTGTGAVGPSLAAASAITTANFSGGMELTVTHGVLTDAAVTNLTSNGNANTIPASSFNGNVASFNLTTAGNIGTTFDITVNFDGTTAIQAWSAGTVDVAFTSTQAGNQLSPLGSTSGSLSAFSRGGFSTQINTAQSTAGSGATLFQSLVRIVNNGSVDGTVSITVRDDADGSVYGTYTTATIEANSSLQVSMATIENSLGITPAGQYQLGLSGPIDGYAQHVMFNSVDGFFSDLSGFRDANP